MRHLSNKGYTLIELLVGVGVFSAVLAGLMIFVSISTGLVSRNLATNHSHEGARISQQTLLSKLRMSATSFRLINATSTGFTDVAATASGNLDSYTGDYRSNQANGVRFWLSAGSPYKLTANTTPTSTNLTFNFAVNGALPYVPQVGDKIAFPLTAREYTITAIVTAPTAASKTGVVTINSAFGYTVDTAGSNITVGCFYRRAAYALINQELQFHPDTSQWSTYTVVRNNVSSPQPFSLLFDTATSASTDGLRLHVSLETTDMKRNNRRLGSTTTTLLSIFTPQNQPTLLTTNN